MKHLQITTAAVILLALLFTPPLFAGDGRWDVDDLELHVYLANKETDAVLLTDADSWANYFNIANFHWWDANEGRSVIKKVFLYNALDAGKSKADVWIDSAGPSARLNGFMSDGVVSLPRSIRTGAAANTRSGQHLAKSLAHEFGHYMYGLKDVYGGQIKDSAGALLPVEWIAPAARQSPFQRTGVAPSNQSYRCYMWSDSWLRFRVPSLAAAPVFYNLSGRSGADPNDSLMGGSRGRTPTRDADYATVASHRGEVALNFAMPRYQWVATPCVAGPVSTRAADRGAQSYKVLNNQEAVNGMADWTQILAYHANRGAAARWPDPGALSAQVGPLQPVEVCVVGNSTIVICLDRSGSMDSDNRMPLAKAGANAAINQLRARQANGTDGEFAGITSFDSSAAVNAAIREIVQASDRTALSSAVNALTPTGSTSIGGGLRTSLNELLHPAHENKTKSIILLSDGAHNAGEAPSSVYQDLKDNHVNVYTIALGSGADTAQLSEIANETGGEMRVSNSPADLVRFFQDLFNRIHGASSGTSSDVALDSGLVYEQDVFVEEGAGRALVSVVMDSPLTTTALETPDGDLITPDNLPPNATYRVEGLETVYEVEEPTPGNWVLILDNSGGGRRARVGPFRETHNPPLAITDNNTVISTLDVTGSGILINPTVKVDITHTYIGDLTLTLTSPANTSIVLHNRSGGSSDDIKGTYGGDLVPVESLSQLAGESVTGIWTLTVQDSAGGDTGEVKSWSIESAGSPPATTATVSVALNSPNIVVNAQPPGDITYPNPIPIRASVIAYGGSVDGAVVTAQVTAPDGAQFTIPLLDNGRADVGDEQAGDGVYSNLFASYSANGAYDVSVFVDGSNCYPANVADLQLDPIADNSVPPFERSFGLQSNVSGVPLELTRFFVIDKLRSVHNPVRPGRDSLNLSGKLNLPVVEEFDGNSENPVFSVGSYSYNTAFGGEWKRLGRRGHRYLYKSLDRATRASMNYFVGGSSLGKYSFRDTKINSLAGVFGTPENVPVRLQIDDLDDTIGVQVDVAGNRVRFSNMTAGPEFFINTFSVRVNPRRLESDRLAFSAKVLGPFAYDPLVHGLNISFGTYAINIAPGDWDVRRSRLSYTLKDGRSRTVVRYDTDRGRLTVRVTNVDLGTIPASATTNVALELTGIPGADWLYQLTPVNRRDTTFFYR